MAVAGDVEAVSLSGRIFAVAGDSDISRKVSGFENEIQMNGDGSSRIIKKRVAGGWTGVIVGCDDTRGDHEFLSALQSSLEPFAVTMTYVDGTDWQGTCSIVGEMQHSSQNGTVSFDLGVQGELTRQ